MVSRNPGRPALHPAARNSRNEETVKPAAGEQNEGGPCVIIVVVSGRRLARDRGGYDTMTTEAMVTRQRIKLGVMREPGIAE